jgi:hypothetical protein
MCRSRYVNALTPYLMPWFSSPTTWYHQHVIGHHSYPNVGHKDPDLAHAPQLMREHVSIKWRPVHKKQHSIWRFGFMWTVAVGLGLHLMADTKLMLQEEYNRVVPAMPGLRCWSWRLSHLLGRVIYLFFSYGWPWFVMDSNLKALVFSVVPMTIFSLLFMLNSQVNHLTPETGHAECAPCCCYCVVCQCHDGDDACWGLCWRTGSLAHVGCLLAAVTAA